MPKYNKQSTVAVDNFVRELTQEAKPNGTFDSAAAKSFVDTALSQNTVEVPKALQGVLDSCDEKGANRVISTILDCANTYQAEHGQPMPADLMEQALHSAYSTTPEMQKIVMDSASGTSGQSSGEAYQANRAIVALLATTTEAIPFAHYLPADIQSNEARLAILQHTAGSDFGSYAQSDLLDGAYSGDRYISASREHTLTHGDLGALTGKITSRQKTPHTCDPDAKPVKLVRGRSIVYVNGLPVGKEVTAQGSGDSSIAGTVVLAGTTHAISGVINTDTGVISLTTAPALAPDVEVVVEAFVDYERDTDFTPELIVQIDTYSLYANSWRAKTQQSIDSRTQMKNELGLDSYSEGVIAIQAQFSNERHYEVLRKARRLAVRNTATYDFKWATAGDYKVRAEIWGDFGSVLGSVSQRMAILTMNHGVTHLYVGEKVAAQLQSLPRDIWQSSGISSRAGIYRLGRLFNQYDVYYTPKGVKEETESAEILCIGQATDVTRNPFILGDAVAPTVIPLATNSDLKSGAGYYARNFTSVNPHNYSANGAALITVTNLF